MCRSFIRRSVIKNELGEFTGGGSRIGRRLLASQDSFIDGAQLQAYAFTLQPKYCESATRKRAVFPAAPSDLHNS
jgi:hypothetical protein